MDIGISEQFKGRYDGYMLLKFTSCQEFQQDFLDGKLFFNTADFFAQCDNLGRGDENEGNTFLIEHNNPDFMSANLESVDGKMMIVVRDYTNNPENYKPGTIENFSRGENRCRKIISLYTAYVNVSKEIISPFPAKMGEEFGEYGVLVLDRKKFFERVCNALRQHSEISKAQLGFVDYMKSEDVHGFIEWNPFSKMPQYEYQNEFRISFINDTQKPLKLDLGVSLRDIAFPIKASDLEEIFFKDNLLYYPLYK